MDGALGVVGGIAGSGALGAVLGGVMAVINRGIGIWEMREKRKDRQIEIAHEKERWGHEKVLLELQRAKAREEDAAALDALHTAGSWDGLTATIADQAARAGKSWPWVDAVIALFRPFLTFLLWTAVLVLWFSGQLTSMPEATKAGLLLQIVNAIVFAATTALTWWFGERPRTSPSVPAPPAKVG